MDPIIQLESDIRKAQTNKEIEANDVICKKEKALFDLLNNGKIQVGIGLKKQGGGVLVVYR